MADLVRDMAVYSSDGNFSYVDMLRVFGSRMGRALPEVPMEQIQQMLNKVGFSSDQKTAIFDMVQQDINSVLDDSTYFLKFLSPMEGHNPSDGTGDGKRRSYIGKNEIARDLLGELAGTLGIVDANMTKKAKLADNDDKLDGVLKINPNGQVILSNNAVDWNQSPLDMAITLLDAIEKDPVARKRVFKRYAEATKLQIDFASFGKNQEKVENEFEAAFIDLLRTGMVENFPKIAYQANKNFLSYDRNASAGKYIVRYEERLTNLKSDYEKLKDGSMDAAKFFVELDRLSAEGAVFGGVDNRGVEIPGVPEGKRTFDILVDILGNDAFTGIDKAGIRADALVRIVDFTYARDPALRKEAMAWLRKDEGTEKGLITTNRATELANKINADINDFNKTAKEEDRISTIDPYKQIGFRKDFRKDAEHANQIVFDSGAKILDIKAHLVNLPATRATVAIWKKADEEYASGNAEMMDKLQRYTYDYVVQYNNIATSKSQNFTALNNVVVSDIKNIEQTYDYEKPETWDSLDRKIAASIDFAKTSPDIQNQKGAEEFNALVGNIEAYMNEYKPSPKDRDGVIVLKNVDDLLNGLIDDKIGVISGGSYSFDLDYFKAEFDKILAQQESGDFSILNRDDEPTSEAIKELMKMNSIESTTAVIKAARDFQHFLTTKKEDVYARIVLDKSPFKGLTYAGIMEIERKDAKDEKGNPYSYAVLHFASGEHNHKVITNGVATSVSRNEFGELPPFEVWKDMAAIYKNLGANRVNVNCDDQSTFFMVASAFANLGIECVNEQVSLSQEQAAEVLKIRQAAIRSDVKSMTKAPVRKVTQMAKDAENVANEQNKVLQSVIDTSLYGDKAAENTSALNKSARLVEEKITFLQGLSHEEIAVEARKAGHLRGHTTEQGEHSDLIERFSKPDTYTSADMVLLAKKLVELDDKEVYSPRTLGKVLSDEPELLKNNAALAAYAADKRDLAKEIINDLRSSFPKTADTMDDSLNRNFDASKTDANPLGSFLAIRNTAEAAKVSKDLSDSDLLNSFSNEVMRQGNIDASFAEYANAKKYYERSLASKELEGEVDSFNRAASYMFGLMRKDPEKLLEMLEKRKVKAALKSKIKKGEKLNLQDIIDVSRAVALDWNGKIITPQKAIELDQKMRYEEIERAYKQISAKGNAIADDNMRKIAGYVYLEAANEKLSQKPVNYVRLKEQIDSLAIEKIHDLGKATGNADMEKAAKIDDLQKVALPAKDFSACKDRLELSKTENIRAVQKQFQQYIAAGKVRE